MAWEHTKSWVTVLFDVIRHSIILVLTAYLTVRIWNYYWIWALVALVPLYVIFLNVVGFATLPIYLLTPENLLKRRAMKAFESGDMAQFEALTAEFTTRFNVNVPPENQ